MSRAREAVNAMNDPSTTTTLSDRHRRAEVLALIGIAESLEALVKTVTPDRQADGCLCHASKAGVHRDGCPLHGRR